ncbi:serine/arginine repetitive matrix protein 4 isoform X2 [Silurus asotus]|uniref:Serine/arginine repetitive matrix protein 4 isoform X2 n=1 Tax=Silurus asotus TaxID=30991 RepID=A0AAD5AAZ2_SILAS|nr:serine/arginine repetitive matrix protein 4 isoform X2 [Silurus asotus]
MASLLQGEKQLFDKFWRGTFKAVATPRPESVIIASIAARRETNRLETSVCVAAKPSETPPEREKQELKETEKKRHRKHRGRKRHRRRHSCHRGFFLIMNRSADTQAERPNLKACPVRAAGKQDSYCLAEARGISDSPLEVALAITADHLSHFSNGLNPEKLSVVHSRPELEPSHVQDAACAQGKGRPDYDSGHDTSSPPSSKTGVSRAQVTVEGQEKVKFLDNSSDSGNSLSSYGSLGKADYRQRRSNTSVFNDLKSEESGSCVGFVSHRSHRSETRSCSRSRSSQSSRHSRRSVSRSRSPFSSRRLRERRRSWSSCEKPSKRSRTRSRRRTCSPMRKRRRDSPSHLEARRITSGNARDRKRSTVRGLVSADGYIMVESPPDTWSADYSRVAL